MRHLPRHPPRKRLPHAAFVIFVGPCARTCVAEFDQHAAFGQRRQIKIQQQALVAHRPFDLAHRQRVSGFTDPTQELNRGAAAELGGKLLAPRRTHAQQFLGRRVGEHQSVLGVQLNHRGSKLIEVHQIGRRLIKRAGAVDFIG